MNEDANPNSREARLQSLVAEFLQAIEAGKIPDREALLARHPDLADSLVGFFLDHDRMHHRAEEMRDSERGAGSQPAEASTIGVHEQPASGPKMVRYFGDYELLQEVARGGMGVVYKARQVNLKRIVALKMILSGQLAGADEVRRFYAEAEAAAKLDHPGIVPIFEVGQHDGQHYFSMAFVEGESLAHKVAHGLFVPREAAALMKKIAEAIAYAHAEGVIHRDLKPANVLIDKDGQSRVTDFGLAKRVQTGDAMSQHTATGLILGTPSYMPPEQASGESDRIGPHSDIYSLGAILYCLLTGRPPFQAATPLDTLLQVLDREPAAPRQLNAVVPRDLETIVLKCLEKEPHKRYGSAGELAQELGRFLNGEPIHARPVGRIERGWRWCRRNPVVAGLATAVFLALVVGTVTSTLFALGELAAKRAAEASAQDERQAKEAEKLARNEADAKALLADANAKRADAKAELARRNAYAARMNQIEALWKQGDQAALVNAMLEGLQPAPGESDLRGWEWHYYWRLGHGNDRSVPSLLPGALDMAFSPDGKRLAAIASSGTIKVFDTVNGVAILTGKVNPAVGVPPHFRITFSANSEVMAVAGGDDGGFAKNEIWAWNLVEGRQTANFKVREIYGIGLSPDGKLLALNVVRGVKIWDLNARREVHSFQASGASLAFSSDGKFLATGDDKVWDVSTGKHVSVPLEKVRGNIIAVSSDGRLGATETENSTVKVWDMDRGVALCTFTLNFPMVQNARFSPDGKRLATLALNLGGSPAVAVWDIKSGTKAREIKVDSAWAVGFSPDSQHLFTADFGATFKAWNVADVSSARTLGGHTGGVNCVVFSPDGKSLLSGDDGGTVRSWEIAIGKEIRKFVGKGQGEGQLAGVVKALAFSLDGKRFASVSRAGRAILWDAASGSIIRTIKNPVQYVDVAFHPDGKKIALAIELLHGEVKLHDLDTGQLLGGRGGDRVAFSPDGKWMATANAVLWDKTGKIMTPGNPIKIWDASSLVEMTELRGHYGNVFQLAFSKEAGKLASAGFDKTVRLWDVVSSKELFVLKGHTNLVMSVAFSPDGNRLATASQDDTVKIWDTQSGQMLITLKHESPGGRALGLWDVAFSPDGRWIAASSQDGTISVWDGQNVAGSDTRTPATSLRIADKD